MACLDENTVLHFLQGVLSAEAAARVEEHVDVCPACRRLAAELIKTGSGVSATAAGAADPELGLGPTLPPDGPRPTHFPFARGTTLGRYVILEQLGAGGMGVVYAAFDPELERK